MRILVWGGGAIGGTVAAYLSRAGHAITIVDANADHVAAIHSRGLTMTGPIDSFTQQVPAFVLDDLDGEWNVVFLCVKALHTATAARQLLPFLAERGAVVSLQNGFNEIAIADVAGKARTIGAFVNFGADVVQPGVIHFGGRGAVVVGELDGGDTARVQDIRRALLDFEPGAIVSDNIWGFLWGKMGYGALLFATALTSESIVDVLASRDVRPTLAALAREVMLVAAAEGVRVMGFNGFDPTAFGPGGTTDAVDASFEAMVAFNRRSAKTHTGVWRDIAVHHRKTEGDAQFEPIISMARRHAIPVPGLERLLTVLREVEAGRRAQARENLARLGASEARIDAHPV